MGRCFGRMFERVEFAFEFSGSQLHFSLSRMVVSHGCGIHTCEDGSRYVGEFTWGVKHGLGHYHFRNVDIYAGEYFADKMHGLGVYSFANGNRYQGSWHEGRRQGLGMYTFRNCERNLGIDKMGSLISQVHIG
ncbi:hypothetical protein L2E82_05562 [Cichorium intybus]|uniref:Uncharacterized protein n=1 Tax=Cichorium intybus TaxID=13427 RepID=A0ACB9H8R4_CICIN|nr:hypothetical protein L2E82_05562 [Cichorium intybus]